VLTNPGAKDGETRVVREPDGAVWAYGWDATKRQWERIGEVVAAPEAGEPQCLKTMVPRFLRPGIGDLGVGRAALAGVHWLFAGVRPRSGRAHSITAINACAGWAGALVTGPHDWPALGGCRDLRAACAAKEASAFTLAGGKGFHNQVSARAMPGACIPIPARAPNPARRMLMRAAARRHDQRRRQIAPGAQLGPRV
jgi:hypothetical protein